MYQEQSFIDEILRKAEQAGVYVEAKEELSFFRHNGQLKYLHDVSVLLQKIREQVFPYPLIRLAGTSSLLGYLLGIHNVNPMEHGLSQSLFFHSGDPVGLLPRFDITLPLGKKEEAVKLLEEISGKEVTLISGWIYQFGEDRIGIYESRYLSRLEGALEVLKRHEEEVDLSKKDEAVIDYMLQEDDQGYFLPNLAGCVYDVPSHFYGFFKEGKPHDLEELAYLISLIKAQFRQRVFIHRHLKSHGLRDTLCCAEQILHALKAYGVEEERAIALIQTIMNRGGIFASDRLLLESFEVPQEILEQLGNLRYIGYLGWALQEVEVAYILAYVRKHHEEEFKSLLPKPSPSTYVGPFFYIDGRVYAHLEDLTAFSPLRRFFDSTISHFSYFNILGFDGDYGNYPRGRVLYDNFRRGDVVYADKDLLKEETKTLILKAFHLEEERVEFRRDAHYQHDGL